MEMPEGTERSDVQLPAGWWRLNSQTNECCCTNVIYQDELRQVLILMKEMAEALEFYADPKSWSYNDEYESVEIDDSDIVLNTRPRSSPLPGASQRVRDNKAGKKANEVMKKFKEWS